jgi:hypothetical protein
MSSDTFGCFIRLFETIEVAEALPLIVLFHTRAAVLMSTKAPSVIILLSVLGILIPLTQTLSIVGVVVVVDDDCRCSIEDLVEALDRLGDRRRGSAQLDLLVLVDGLCEKMNT